MARFEFRSTRPDNVPMGMLEDVLGLLDGERPSTRRRASTSKGRQQSPKEK
jgi:hypothetical protein